MAKNENKKILLTGGHAATTALATTEEIIRRAKDWDIYWVGTKRALEGSGVETLESKALPGMGVRFHPITAGRLQIKFSVWTIPSLAKIPVGFVQAFLAVRRIKPDIVLSFGGAAAFSVVFWAWAFRIPVLVHEQTSAAGRANKLSSPFARKILLSRQSSAGYFPEGKATIVGNPIMTQIAEISPKENLGSPPTLFVTGGSRGSRTINNLVEEILEDLLEKYRIIHQTGDLDYEKFKKLKKSLSDKLSGRYEVYPLVDPMQIDGIYKRADMVVARAGANTVSELVVTKRPCLLIPIPWSHQDEQRKNALYAKEFGIATILDQATVTPEELLSKIEEKFENWADIVKMAKDKKSPDLEAAKKLVDLLEEYIK